MKLHPLRKPSCHNDSHVRFRGERSHRFQRDLISDNPAAVWSAYGLTVPGDSGSLTSGMSQSAIPAKRGATMALHSTVGFGLSALGAWGTGVALDPAGGPASPAGWLAAFSLLAVGILLGPAALWWPRSKLSRA